MDELCPRENRGENPRAFPAERHPHPRGREETRASFRRDLHPPPGSAFEISPVGSWNQPCSAISATSSSGLRSLILRKIIQTPARTKQPPSSDQRENVSPPSNQPSMTAPGGVISGLVCKFVTVIRGSSQ